MKIKISSLALHHHTIRISPRITLQKSPERQHPKVLFQNPPLHPRAPRRPSSANRRADLPASQGRACWPFQAAPAGPVNRAAPARWIGHNHRRAGLPAVPMGPGSRSRPKNHRGSPHAPACGDPRDCKPIFCENRKRISSTIAPDTSS